MATALKCDRCGKFFELSKDHGRKYRIRESELYKDEKYIDLCPDCYDKLLNFMVDTDKLYPGEFESRHYEFEGDSDGSSST